MIDKRKVSYNAERNRKINAIKNNELNKECFDCGSCYPDYISLNNGIFICKDCLRLHNKFPKEISNTIKNNLPSLNTKELEIMYLGGNQKLMEFINYDYPQLQKFKTSILYQTKAMQYYRNNLKFMVYGGPRPIKPSEKINAYELVDINECATRNEKINTKSNNKIYRMNLNNKKTRNVKRNKSTKRVDNREAKSDKRDRKINYKIQQPKERKEHSVSRHDDHLKRHKSFYKEMSKLFGENYENENDNKNKNLESFLDTNNADNSSIYRKQNIKKDYNKETIKSEGNNYKISKYIPNTDGNNKYINTKDKDKDKDKDNPGGNIYNNNYFTLSATKNIFMFAPNKDSIIYKHRKINTNESNKSNNNNQSSKEAKDVYYKPKIPYLINTNRREKNKDENLFFSVQDNNNNTEIKNDDNSNNNIKNQNKLNYNIKTLNTYTIKNMKHNKTNISESLNNKIYTKDNNDIKDDEGNKNTNNNNNNIGGGYMQNRRNNEPYNNNTINYRKREIKLNNNNSREKRGNNFIIYRNDNKGNKVIIDYKNDKNKTDSKNNINDTATKSINNKITPNEIEANSEDIKNRTFFNNMDMKNLKRRIFNKMNINISTNDNVIVNKTENSQTNPIRIEEGEAEIIAKPNKINIKEEMKNSRNYVRLIEKRNIYNANTSESKKSGSEIKRIYNKNDEKKDEIKSNNTKNLPKIEKIDFYFKKDINNKKIEILPIEKGGLEKKQEYSRYTSDNFKQIQNKKIYTDTSSSLNENVNSLDNSTKFSIRNKYKMKKLKEMI